MQPGVSFSPLNAQAGPTGQNGASPLQDAIKILSFRMPTVVGALGQPTLPGSGGSPLLGGPGGMATDWLTNLFRGLAPADTGGQPMTGAPTNPVNPGGGNAPPSFTDTQPPGPPPQGPPGPRVIMHGPQPIGPDMPPVAPPPDTPDTQPPDFRNWLTGGGWGGNPGNMFGR